MFVYKLLNRIVHVVHDVDFEPVAKQGMTAAFVNHFALRVHHIVVFEQTLTYAKVVFFYFLLCPFNRF
jgi:hypothetical protein